MDSRDLTAEQRQRMLAELVRHMTYFNKLSARMKTVGWYTSSGFAVAVRQLELACHLAIICLNDESKLPKVEIRSTGDMSLSGLQMKVKSQP